MFDEQLSRLLREHWPNAKMLADELYAMFRGWEERGLTNLILQQPPGDQPAIRLNGWDSGDIVIQVRGRGGIDLGSITFTGGTLATPDATGVGGGTVVAGANAFPGRVVSGTGSTYQVDIYPNGLGGEAERVSVTQMLIDEDETIPGGTPVLVVRSGANYYMQVPVVLE